MLIIFSNALNISISQNLVPNGDFELGPDTTSVGWAHKLETNCAITTPMAGPDYWTVTTVSPDRLIEGQIYCNWTNDTPQSGHAYIVVGGYEGGKATLNSPLEQDSTYELSYYLRWETFRGLEDSIACRIQFNFSGGDTLFSPSDGDSVNWQYYDTIFVASANSTEMEIKGAALYSAAEIDNVSLVKIVETGILEYYEKRINIFPNPFNEEFHCTVKSNETLEIIIFDVTGRKIFNQEFNNSITVNDKNLLKGIYIYELKNKNGCIKRGKLIKE